MKTSYDIVDSIDLITSLNNPKTNLTAAIISLLVCSFFGTILELNGYSYLLMLIILLLLIPGTVVHELIHYLFQWYYSHKKPHLGFKFPFPYSALNTESSYSRNQAIFTALAPFIIITLLLIIPAIFVGFLPRIILFAWASIEGLTCYVDFYFVFRLLKYPSYISVKNINLKNTIIKYTQ